MILIDGLTLNTDHTAYHESIFGLASSYERVYSSTLHLTPSLKTSFIHPSLHSSPPTRPHDYHPLFTTFSPFLLQYNRICDLGWINILCVILLLQKNFITFTIILHPQHSSRGNNPIWTENFCVENHQDLFTRNSHQRSLRRKLQKKYDMFMIRGRKESLFPPIEGIIFIWRWGYKVYKLLSFQVQFPPSYKSLLSILPAMILFSL